MVAHDPMRARPALPPEETTLTSNASPAAPWHRHALAAALALILAATLAPAAAPASAHEGNTPPVQVSSAANRSPSGSLAGATISGTSYLFVAVSQDVASVEFWLDNPAGTGAPRQVEREAPYDFAGGSASAANPFDTRTL